MKKISLKSILTAFLLIFTLSVSAQDKTVNILAINDMHAYLDRFAQFGGVVDSLRAIYPDLFIISSGDNRTGNPFNDMYPEPSRPMTELMNAIGFNVSTLGNHEFDAGFQNLKKLMNLSTFPHIVCNVFPADSMGYKFDPYKIFDVNGVKVGILGVLQINSQGIPDCHPDKAKGIRFTPVVQTVEKYADALRKQCDIEILVSHIGFDEDKEMAQKFPMFDAILGGHSHTYVESNTLVNNVLITQSKNKVRFCTLVQFTLKDGKVVSKSSKVIDIENSKLKSEKIEKMVADFCKNPELEKRVTTLEKPVKGYDNFGCMMTDGQAASSNCQIAIQNGGGVRFDYHDAGDFTVKDALMLDPFGNLIWTFKLTGKQILDVIKLCKERDEGVEPYVSGMSYIMYVDKDDPNKVLEVKGLLPNGKPIKPKKVYTVAANSYTVSITDMQQYGGVETTKTSCDCMREFLSKKASVDYSNTRRAQIIKK